MIDAVLFDLGGVLLGLEPQRSAEAFAQLGAPGFMDIWRQDTPQKSLYRLEIGAIDATQFRAEVVEALAKPLSDDAFDTAFCAMLGDIAPATLRWLAALKLRRPLYLLSNNNVLHLGHIERRYPSLRGFFSRAYFSQEIARSKPEPAAFSHAIADAKLEPARTLFVDDSLANIEAGAAVGLATLLLPRNGDVVSAVEARLAR